MRPRRVIDRSHDRPGQTIYDWRHYLAVVHLPGALRNSAPFAELPGAFRTLQQYLLKKPGGELKRSISCHNILNVETGEREVRSTAYQLRTARFPAYRDLNGFAFASREIDEALVQLLHRCDFLDEAHVVSLCCKPCRMDLLSVAGD